MSDILKRSFFKIRFNKIYVTFIFFLSLIIGSLVCSNLCQEKSQILIQYYKAFSFTSFNTVSYLLPFILLGLVIISSYFAFGAALVSLVLFYYGYSLGFSMAFLYASLGYKGLLLCAIAVVPQCVMLSYALFISSSYAIDTSFNVFSYSFNIASKMMIPVSRYMQRFIIPFILTLSSILFNAFIARYLFKLFI